MGSAGDMVRVSERGWWVVGGSKNGEVCRGEGNEEGGQPVGRPVPGTVPGSRTLRTGRRGSDQAGCLYGGVTVRLIRVREG